VIRLQGRTHFLVLEFSKDAKRKTVAFYERFDKAFEDWDVCRRISPVFPLNNAELTPLTGAGRNWLLFMGPVYPGKLPDVPGANLYLSLGVLNVVAHTRNAAARAALLNFAAREAPAHEIWTLDDAKIVRTAFTADWSNGAIESSFLEPLRLSSDPLKPTLREHQALLANAVARAGLYRRPTKQRFATFGRVIRERVEGDATTQLEKLQYLVTANVALSRHLWQAYSGATPIGDNPCHLATHSLLAIGTASAALETLTRFITSIHEDARLDERLGHLKNVRRYPKRLTQVTSSDPFWDRAWLFESDPAFPAPTPEESAADPPLPQITYFSGRDGFRSTTVTISAPIEVIAACNTQSWTLQTLTHELTHTLIHSILGELLPDTTKPTQVDRIIYTIEHDPPDISLLDQLRAYTTFALWFMTADVTTQRLTPHQLSEHLEKHTREFDEVMTHVFDFLYHYHADPILYLRAIWASWATIPHIDSRVPEYVSRTIAAVHANNLRRQNGLDLTIDSVSTVLGQVQAEFPDAVYIQRALDELARRRRYYRDTLFYRVPLIRFVRYILYSPHLAKRFQEGSAITESLVPEEFDDTRIPNPLLFVQRYAQDHKHKFMKSVWILQHLAAPQVTP
jgi:hypothetical protein